MWMIFIATAGSLKVVLYLSVLTALIVIIFHKKSLLKILLLLEMIGLILVTVWSEGSASVPPSYFLFSLLVFLVAEAALGLGVLVALSRSKGDSGVTV